jgi:hypothetical protein
MVSTLLYASESWRVLEKDLRTLETFSGKSPAYLFYNEYDMRTSTSAASNPI